METSERTLIGLKFVLEQFGIIVATPMMVQQSRPLDMDYITAVIALVQLIHPMGYTMKVIRDEGTYKLRSDQLARDILQLRKTGSRGDLLLASKRLVINPVAKRRIDKVLQATELPDQVPFSPKLWIFLSGLYAGMQTCVSDEKITEVVINDYLPFMPYMDLAEEAVTKIQEKR